MSYEITAKETGTPNIRRVKAVTGAPQQTADTIEEKVHLNNKYGLMTKLQDCRQHTGSQNESGYDHQHDTRNVIRKRIKSVLNANGRRGFSDDHHVRLQGNLLLWGKELYQPKTVRRMQLDLAVTTSRVYRMSLDVKQCPRTSLTHESTKPSQ